MKVQGLKVKFSLKYIHGLKKIKKIKKEKEKELTNLLLLDRQRGLDTFPSFLP